MLYQCLFVPETSLKTIFFNFVSLPTQYRCAVLCLVLHLLPQVSFGEVFLHHCTGMVLPSPLKFIYVANSRHMLSDVLFKCITLKTLHCTWLTLLSTPYFQTLLISYKPIFEWFRKYLIFSGVRYETVVSEEGLTEVQGTLLLKMSKCSSCTLVQPRKCCLFSAQLVHNSSSSTNDCITVTKSEFLRCVWWEVWCVLFPFELRKS